MKLSYSPSQATLSAVAVSTILQPLPLHSHYNSSDVVFVDQRAANVLPYFFERGPLAQLWGTTTQSHEINGELKSITAASFIAFDKRFFEIIGPSPKLEKLFDLPENQVHEAPNYLAKQNKIFVSNINATYEYLIDLSTEPPQLQNLSSHPQLQSVNGGFPYKGKLIVGTDGFRDSSPPGLYLYDPATNNSEPLLNNYRGLKLGTPDDLVVDQHDQVWFVDAPYGWIASMYDRPPETAPSVYRFNMSSGGLHVVDQTIRWPNGIAFSPDEKILYVTETPIGLDNNTQPHAITAFDVLNSRMLANKRTLYVPDTYFGDGLKVSETGNLYTAAGSAIDVVTPGGELLGKIHGDPTETFNNLVFLPNGEIYITGVKGIWRARIKEQGIVHS